MKRDPENERLAMALYADAVAGTRGETDTARVRRWWQEARADVRAGFRLRAERARTLSAAMKAEDER